MSNDAEEAEYKAAKAEKMGAIMDLIKNVHLRTFKEPLDITMDDLMTAEAQQKFVNKLETMGIAEPKLIEFLKDQSQEEVIKR